MSSCIASQSLKTFGVQFVYPSKIRSVKRKPTFHKVRILPLYANLNRIFKRRVFVWKQSDALYVDLTAKSRKSAFEALKIKCKYFKWPCPQQNPFNVFNPSFIRSRREIVPRVVRWRNIESFANTDRFGVLEVEPLLEVNEVEELEELEDAAPFYFRRIPGEQDFEFPIEAPVHLLPEVRQRNIDLIRRLRAVVGMMRLRSRVPAIVGYRFGHHLTEEILTWLNNSALTQRYHGFFDSLQRFALPMVRACIQSDGIQDAHGADNLTENNAGNVILTESRQESSDITSEPQARWHDFVSSDIKGGYTSMVDRWLNIHEFTWQTNQAQNYLLAELDLPEFVLSSKNVQNTPNVMPFLVHRYWRGDMEIKVQLNSNKFQMGQLQVGWFYESDLDDKFSLRKHACTISQTSHVLISAGNSNEASLYIPFKNHLAMMSTKTRSDRYQTRSLGKLIINVLNPLCVPANGPTACYGSIFIRFTNNTFTGQIASNFDAYPQMLPALKVASQLMKNLDIPNCDNPPRPQNPNFLVPTASHSWAYGTGDSEPVHSLRLDASGQTKHPDNLPDEMSIKFITKKYGYVKTFNWLDSAGYGTKILDIDAAPILSKDNYKKITKTQNNLDSYYMPPVAVIASLFNYWRGNIKFRFDFVATQFHTGRILLAYIPGSIRDSKNPITIQDALASPHVVFTLNEAQQFEYEIPYITDKPYWPRLYTGNFSSDQVYAPSRLVMFVLNPLIIMQSVYKTVNINMYMCGGDSFEVAVPVQPCIGLGFNTQVLYNSSELIYAIGGTSPYYCGNWHSFLNSAYLMLRYSEVSDHYSTFDVKFFKNDTSKFAHYYKYLGSSSSLTYVLAGKTYNVQFGVLVWADKESEYAIMVPCVSETGAKLACLRYQIDGQDPKNCTPYFVHAEYDPANRYSDGNPYWAVFSTTMVEDQALPQGERDQSDNTLNPTTVLQSTNSGAYLFGESFNSLKDLARRYQVYTSFNISPIVDPQPGQCSYIIPIIPQGLDLNLGTSSSVIELANRCRDGHIPIICSAFRYFRGSLRFRFVFPTTRDVVVWLQHRPDRKVRQLIPIRCPTVTTAEALANHSYASYIQDTGVNSIVEIEVPFYQNGVYGLLQRPKPLSTEEAYYYSLGELSLGVVLIKGDISKVNEFLTTVYYSFADDMQCSTFQGFPPVVLLDDIVNVKPQIEYAHPQGPKDWINSVVNSVKSDVKREISDAVTETAAPILNVAVDELTNMRQRLENTNFSSLLDTSVFRTIATNVAHIMANFNWKSICIGIASILVEFGLITFALLNKCVSTLQNLFIQLKITLGEPGDQPNPPDIAEIAEEVAQPQGDDEDATVGLITLIWTSICSLFSVVKTPPKSIINLNSLLTKDLTNVFRSSNQVFIFLRNIFSVIEPMKIKIFGYISPEYRIANLLVDEYAHMRSWVDEVVYLSDPKNFDKNRYTQEYKARINVSFLRGQIYFKTLPEVQNQQVYRIIAKYYDIIFELREKMIELGDDNYVRFEPFVMWQAGAAGVGKSTIMTEICMRLLGDLQIKTDVPPIYNHNISSDHWDSCQNNPVMLVDDMFCVQQNEMLDRYLSTLFSVVSPVVLNPPKARLEDKGKAYSNLRIFAMNSNYTYVAIPNVDLDAIHRRRHVLWEAQLIDFSIKENFDLYGKPGCNHCKKNLSPSQSDPVELADFHHLLFVVYKNPVNNTQPPEVYPPMVFKDFYSFLSKKCKEVLDKNEKMYKERLQRVLDSIASASFDDTVDINEAFEKYQAQQLIEYKKMLDSSWLNKIRRYNSDVANRVNMLWTSIVGREWNLLNHPTTTVQSDSSLISAQPQNLYDDNHIGFNFPHIRSKLEENYRYPHTHQHIPWEYSRIFDVIQNHGNENHDESAYSNDSVTLIISLLTYNYSNLTHDNFMSKFQSVVQNDIAFCDRIMACTYHGAEETMHYRDFFCKHVYMKPYNLVYDKENNKVYDITDENKENVMFCCTTQDRANNAKCFIGHNVLRYFFYCNIIRLHPEWDCKKFPQTQNSMKSIPIEFRLRKLHDYPTVAMWKQFFLYGKITLQQCVKKFGQLAMNFYSFVEEYLPLIIPAIACLTVIAGSLIQYATSNVQLRRTQLEKVVWTVPQGLVYNQTQSNINLNENVPKFIPQSDIPQLDVAISRILENYFTVTVQSSDKVYKFTGLVIKDRMLLVLRHFLEEIASMPGDKKYYGKYSQRHNYLQDSLGVNLRFDELPTSHYMKQDSDMTYPSNFVIVYLPNSVPQAKDITKFFATSKDHIISSGDGLMVQNDGKIVENLTIVRERSRPIVISATQSTSAVKLQDMYSYRLQRRGLCGSIILGRGLQRPILGIHVAGVESGNIRGLSEILSFETFNDVVSSAKVYTDYIIPNLTDKEFSKINVDSMIYPLGCTDSKLTAHQGGETQYIPSLVHGVFPVDTEPNPLRKNDPRLPPNSTPLQDGIAHFGRPPLDFPRQDLIEASFDLKRVIIQNVKPIRGFVGVASLSDVIVGRPDIPGFEPLEWSTSPGYPLRFLNDGKAAGKKWLFNLEETPQGYKLLGLNPKLERILTFDQNCRNRNIKPFTVFIDCLKDTCIPVEKCSVPGKTRIFSISPVQFTIQFKQYFIDFMASYQQARFNAEHGIGIDVNSLEWTELASCLQSRGSKVICGDYKNFGPGLMLSAAQCAFDIICDWYAHYGGEEDNRVRRIMISEILGAYHLATNLIYTTPCGIPSGSPITTPLNSLVGSLYIRVMWRRITNLSFVDFHSKCWLVTYGDDVCINISDDISEIFNTETISEEFQKFSITFTDADKSNNIVKYRSLLDSTFLKCSFRPHPKRLGVWLAALDKRSIQGCANWINKRNPRQFATKQNCEQSIMLAHGWGEDYYNFVIDSLLKACQDLNIVLDYQSWNSLDSHRYGKI